MKRVFLSLLSSMFLFSSCRSQQSANQVILCYHLKPKLVLDVDAKYVDELIHAMETAKFRHTVNGRVVKARPANEENLNGYLISVKKRDGQRALHSLHNNFPFSISKGNKSIYNFKHLLSEKDVRALYMLIPAWDENKS